MGRIKSLTRTIVYSNKRVHIHKGTFLLPSFGRRGYYRVTLFKDNKRYKKMLHRIVAEAFLPNTENKSTVNHKLGDKSDNRASELEWSTHSEQNIHAHKHLGRGRSIGVGKKVCQLNDDKIIKVFKSFAEAERTTSICKTSIIDCVNGRAKTAGGFTWQLFNK